MRRVWRVTLIVVLAALVTLALSGALASVQAGALTMLPALVLAVMMLTRPYLGERLIARMRARRQRSPGAERPSAAARPHMAAVRGGRLIAMALAGRAPPCVPAACR